MSTNSLVRPGKRSNGATSPVAPFPGLEDLRLNSRQAYVVRELMEENDPDFHPWILVAANRMRNCAMKPEDAFTVLRLKSHERSRFVPDNELKGTIAKAYSTPFDSATTVSQKSEFSSLPTEVKLRSMMASPSWPKNYGLVDLLNEAPEFSEIVREQSPAVLLSYLFHRAKVNETGMEQYVCVGRRILGRGYHSKTIPLDYLDKGLDLGDFNFVVPNLADKASGFTKEGKSSLRSLDMFPDRKFLVLESDLGEGTEDLQAALIRFTMEALKRRPVMIVHSGSKSLHSWWNVEDLDEGTVTKFLNEMAGLFDSAAKSRHQLFRLPNARRGKGEKNAGTIQKVLWVDVKQLVKN